MTSTDTRDLTEDRLYFQQEIARKGAGRVGTFTRRNLGIIPEHVHRMLDREFPELNLPTVDEYEAWLETN